jgi:hypothetical protein
MLLRRMKKWRVNSNFPEEVISRRYRILNQLDYAVECTHVTILFAIFVQDESAHVLPQTTCSHDQLPKWNRYSLDERR